MSKSKGTDIVTIALLGALGVGGFLIFKNRKEIGNFFGGIGEGVQDFTNGVGDWYGKTVKDIQQGVDDIGKNVGGFFDGLVKGTTGFFEDLSGSYVNFIGGAGKGLENTVTGIQKGAAEFADNVGDFFGGIAQGVTDFFSGKRLEEAPPLTTTPAPETSNTVIKNGKLVEKDSFIKALEKVSGQEVKEIIGAPSTLTKEERAKLPTKSFEELAKRNDFIGRVANIALKVKEGGYTGNILQNLKK